jgi:glycosyltransferase involved in cell wall biosynthesis
MKVATIVVRRELASARTLAASLAATNPEMTLSVLMLDGGDGAEGGGERFELVAPSALELPDFELLAAELDEEGLREVCKPLLLEHLLARDGDDVLYLGADSLVLGPLADVAAAVRAHTILLWPRVEVPLPHDGRRPHEADLREWGLYDGGLLALAGGADHSEALRWWAQRVQTQRSEQQGAEPLERLATLGAHVVSDAGLGTSFWNLPGRTLEQRGEEVLIDATPLRLLRLSGYDPAAPAQLSRFQDRLHLGELGPLTRICEDYAAQLRANGEEALGQEPYGFGSLPDGTRLDSRLREIWTRARSAAGLTRSPFTPEGMEDFYAWLAAPPSADAAPGINRLAALICELQPEVGTAYADLSDPAVARGLMDWLGEVGAEVGTLPLRLLPAVSAEHDEGARVHRARERVLGVNVAGYFSSELGVGEAARLIVAALDSVEVPLLPVRVPDAPPSRQGQAFATVPANAARFPFNLICVNADGLPGFRRAVGRQFFEGRYNIGVWWWEVGNVPPELQASFQYLDELWVGSAHVARAFAAQSPVPIYTITQPVIRPRAGALERSSLGIEADRFMFLYMFDHHSVFERKNPLAVVEAFTLAFPPDSTQATLVIKSINGEDDPSNRERLRRAAAAHPAIRLLEGYLSAADNLALTGACDSYVSLHRSEGFALTPAEAMALGKPVIATGYSGNLEYMTPFNSYLVDYELTAIGPGNDPYPAEAEWAAPDTAHAARLMRELVEDPAAARARGERAAADIARTHSLAAAGASMKRRLDELGARVDLGARGLASLAEPVDPTPRLVRGGGWRGRLREEIGRRVRRAIEEDLVALRESVHALHRAGGGVHLAGVVAANDAARTQAATLAALRRFELAAAAEESGAAAPAADPRPLERREAAAAGGEERASVPRGPAPALVPPPAPSAEEHRASA